MSGQEGHEPTDVLEKGVLKERRDSEKKVIKENQSGILAEDQKLMRQILRENSGRGILKEVRKLERKILKENQGQKPKARTK